MDFHYQSGYQTLNDTYCIKDEYNTLFSNDKCNLCNILLTNSNLIEFIINNKLVKVCSKNCMYKVKNIYNYLKN